MSYITVARHFMLTNYYVNQPCRQDFRRGGEHLEQAYISYKSLNKLKGFN